MTVVTKASARDMAQTIDVATRLADTTEHPTSLLALATAFDCCSHDMAGATDELLVAAVELAAGCRLSREQMGLVAVELRRPDPTPEDEEDDQ